MRLFVLTALAMCAFAANSVLNRFAVGMGQIDPVSFAVLRLLAGAGMLAALVGVRGLGGGVIWAEWPGRFAGVVGLTVYLFAFSLAYVALNAGAGALILFGSVQITMFAGALLSRDRVPHARWAGAGFAFAGLMVLLWPGGGVALSHRHAVLMAVAGVGWGMYSLAGRRAGDPLAGTAANFVLSLPLGIAAGLALGMMPTGATGLGVMLAVVSGAITSGLGYALWYAVVPALGAGRAAVVQLSVPVLTAAAGVALLGETVDLRFVLAAACVLGGVMLASRA